MVISLTHLNTVGLILSSHFINKNDLVELLQNDFLKAIVVHFVADRVEVVLQKRDVQAEVKLRLVVAEGEGVVADGHLGYVAHSAALKMIDQ